MALKSLPTHKDSPFFWPQAVLASDFIRVRPEKVFLFVNVPVRRPLLVFVISLKASLCYFYF